MLSITIITITITIKFNINLNMPLIFLVHPLCNMNFKIPISFKTNQLTKCQNVKLNNKLLNVPVEEHICLSILYCEWVDAAAVAVVKLVPLLVEAVARIGDVVAAV